jgi:hypothetical protein
MRAVILGFLCGLPSAGVSAQSAPLAPKPAAIELARHRQSSWCAMAVDAVGTGTTGATNGEIGTGATVFRTGVPTTLGTQVGAIPSQISAAPLRLGYQ